MTRPGTPHASFDVRAAGAARLLETYRGEAKGAAGLTEGAFGVDTFVRMVPRNPIAAAAAGEMLAMIVFALIFGVTARFGFDVLVSLLKYVATFGVSLTLPQQLVVVVMAVVTAVGAAGVPGGSIPLLAMVLGMMGVPAEGIAIVLGADRLLDMCRTAVNVTGDLVTAAVVERVEQRRVRSVGDEFAVVTEPGRRASGT